MNSRALTVLLVLCLSAATSAAGQTTSSGTVTTLTTSLPIPTRGSLGGISMDMMGKLYVSNFRDKVWQLEQDGTTVLLADGIYGASGNAIDSKGRLLQASFYGNLIYRISRTGEKSILADEGLDGPVGVVVGANDDLYVVTCRGGEVKHVSGEGEVSLIHQSDLLACPNGIARDAEGNLFVTNFNNNHVVQIDPDGKASILATLDVGENGNAHIAIAAGQLYVTRIKDNYVYKVSYDGSFEKLFGNGQPQDRDGALSEATVARPNGIVANRAGTMLFINTIDGTWRDFQNQSLLRVRRIDLPGN